MTRRRWMLMVASLGACACAAVVLRAACQRRPGSSWPTDKRETTLSLRITDADTGEPLPALVSFRTASGAQVYFGNFADPPGWAQGPSAMELGEAAAGVLAFRHGIGLWRGAGTVPVGRPWRHARASEPGDESELPHGLYRLQITQGVEYDAVEVDVDLRAGRGDVSLSVPLTRVMDSAGYVSADLHVHNAPESRDAYVDASTQLKIAAVNGLEVIVSTNHDAVLDLGTLAAELWKGAQPPLATVAGVEVGSTNSHFGVFPLPRGSRVGPTQIRPWPLEAFFTDLRALPGKPLIVLNHPRLGWQAYLDESFCGAWATHDYRAPPPCPQDYDALEVLNGWQTCGTRMREATETWLALASYNHVSAAVGGSDSHFASAMVAGYPRTWVRMGKDEPLAGMKATALADAIRARHTVASNAPLVTLRSGLAGEGDVFTHTAPAVPLSIRVQAANWVKVDTLRLLVDGQVVKSWKIPVQEGAVDFRVEETLALTNRDAFITAETDSQTPLPPHLVGEYNSLFQYGLAKCAPRHGESPGLPAFAVTTPLFVDRNGDGLFQGFRAATPRKL